MTSREFYQIMDRALEPECKRLGFSRKRGTVSLWSVDLPTGRFFYEVSKGPKSPFIPYLGGSFKIDCDLTSSADHKVRGLQTAISYMEYFSDADLSAMVQLQDRVLHKIINQKPLAEFDRLMLESHAPLLQMQIGSQFRRHQVFKLPYLDCEDVSEWGLFLASHIEQTLVGARERPVFFMRAEGGQPDGAGNSRQAEQLSRS